MKIDVKYAQKQQCEDRCEEAKLLLLCYCCQVNGELCCGIKGRMILQKGECSFDFTRHNLVLVEFVVRAVVECFCKSFSHSM